MCAAGVGGDGSESTGANVNLFVGDVLCWDDGWLRHHPLDLESLDVTPDRILRRVPDIFVASVEARSSVEDTVLVESAATPPPTEGAIDGLWRITFYSAEEGLDGILSAEGRALGWGMVACSTHWDFGQRFRLHSDNLEAPIEVVCRDRGGAVTQRNHLDMWFPTDRLGRAWLQKVGDRVMVEVLE